MTRDGWTLRSSLWFVFLVALGLKAATGTWSNLKRGSIDYHRQMADSFESRSVRHFRLAKLSEDNSSSKTISDPAIAAEQHQAAISWAESARSDSLLAASLAKKAELCEQSPVGWIVLGYETSRNPPDLLFHHVSGQKQPWLERGTLAHSTMMALAHVDFFGLASLALAIVVGRRFARARGVEGRPSAPPSP